jgi:hypothetical protein
MGLTDIMSGTLEKWGSSSVWQGGAVARNRMRFDVSVKVSVNTKGHLKGGPKLLIPLMEQRTVNVLASALRTRRSAKLSYCPTRG